jgi:NitT/TauT family transport system permease protein
MQRDLMHTYAASYWQSLLKLRLPTALPFHLQRFENLHDPCADRGHRCRIFRLSDRGHGLSHKNRGGALAMDMVWASIAVAAMAGTAFYGLVAFIERRLTFWHPSQRTG